VWDPLGPLWGPFPIWTFWDPFGTPWDPSGPFGTPLGPLWTLWDPFETPLGPLCGTLWDPCGTPVGPFRPLGPSGTTGTPLGPLWDLLGLLWDHFGNPSQILDLGTLKKVIGFPS
jgi:hypothetical protein